MADLLRRLRQEQRHLGPTAYLDTLLAAFAKEDKRPKRSPQAEPTKETSMNPSTPPKPASGYQVLSAHSLGDAHLTSSAACLARQGPGTPFHAGLGSRRLRQNYSPVHLGPVAGQSTTLESAGCLWMRKTMTRTCSGPMSSRPCRPKTPSTLPLCSLNCNPHRPHPSSPCSPN